MNQRKTSKTIYISAKKWNRKWDVKGFGGIFALYASLTAVFVPPHLPQPDHKIISHHTDINDSNT